ncbi:hypothetical protein J1P26_21835 [Neobacillus sp. MM2021_6]|uniref:hypothetical protein n=1 Tax=Bacillaceae TaxID=186817 RepID=UPI00140E6DC0|nr:MULTISPECIES: hypothetical protein [Bacillaceae]MBO0962348.1 hypothetical protein [Neobacillus sp. MM2021_6]NHC20831.1 hypothetical protein [Bacillus sp. MM2020_4]
MLNKRGGIVPDNYGLSLTVFVQDATVAAPVKGGAPLKLANTGAYHAVKCADGDAIQLIAKHTVTNPDAPLGVHVYGFSRNDEIPYTGAIAVGDPVVANGAGGVKKAGAANGTFVALVNDSKKTVEVLLP